MIIDKINEDTGEVLISDIKEEEWYHFVKAGHKLSGRTDWVEASCFARYFEQTLKEYIERKNKELSCDA